MGELFAIYVDPEAWGRGAGRALMDTALASLREHFDEAVLWVLEDNPRTRRFYELAGWVHDGGRDTFSRWDVDAPVVRYRIAL